ncbi:MAG TPA: phosphatase PAP2 family protein [Burkholderiales bacterium]|nr:phosphatase PAP2 family protein [Burkholderiales bacterium]
MAEALIKHREGIVGEWRGPFPFTQLVHEDPDNLARWEPWVRHAVWSYELESQVFLSRHQEGRKDAVTLWNMNTQHVGAAPRPTSAARRIVTLIRPTRGTFRRQARLVQAWADLRADRSTEILSQLTPPAAFWTSIVGLHPDRTRWTLELIDLALGFAAAVEQRFKHALPCMRPHDLSPQIQPMILCPGHSSFPSGHSTEAFMVAFVLWRLLRAATPAKDPLWAEQLMRQAARIAINRTIAGVHFPVDSAAGELLGLTLGEYFVRRCRGAGAYTAWRFDGTRYQGNDDFRWRLLFNGDTGQRINTSGFCDLMGPEAALGSPMLRWLWNRAVAELQ